MATAAAVMGREAAYSGQVIKWDDFVSKGRAYFPADGYADESQNPPVMPDKDGFYETSVPVPGIYKPYRS